MKVTNMLKRLIVAVGIVLTVMSAGQAQADAEDPAHDELRALMKELVTAYNAGDLDKVVTYLDDNVVITWQNAHVDKSPQEVKAFCELMIKGPNRIVDKSSISPEADALSQLSNDGQTAIAYGHSNDHYKLTNGTEFDQLTRWSATLIKKKGQWKVANVHISTNMFDNPVLNLAVKKTALWSGGLGAAGGIIFAFVISWLVYRRKIRSVAEK
jgi:ketosteroid isomerase-like protein